MTDTPLTLSEIIGEMRGVVKQIKKAHTDRCREKRDDPDYDPDYYCYRSIPGGRECDCQTQNVAAANSAMKKLLDYVDGKDFKVTLEFTMSWE